MANSVDLMNYLIIFKMEHISKSIERILKELYLLQKKANNKKTELK